MPRFRKKPVTIEAFQMTEARSRNRSEWPAWLCAAWSKHVTEPGCLYPDPFDVTGSKLIIGTLEGAHEVSWDDWIIQGVKGELYPCKPDIFEATYEPVE